MEKSVIRVQAAGITRSWPCWDRDHPTPRRDCPADASRRRRRHRLERQRGRGRHEGLHRAARQPLP